MARCSSFLTEIVSNKKRELRAKKRRLPFSELDGLLEGMQRPLSFGSAISGKLSIIAEIKRKSPSHTKSLRAFDPIETARLYELGGAAAISVVTDEHYFATSAQDLREARSAVRLPILRKDFVVDEYQILESRLLGADALLLIGRILSTEALRHLLKMTDSLGMEALVEVHNEEDLEKALEIGASVIGVNNRDLDTLEIDLSTTERLVRKIPDGCIVVSESGFSTRMQIEYFNKLGVDAFLIGGALLDAPSTEEKLKELLGRPL